MPSKQELLEENDALIDLLQDIDEAVDLPRSLQQRLDDFFEDDEDEDDDNDNDNDDYEEVITINPKNPKRKVAGEDDDAA